MLDTEGPILSTCVLKFPHHIMMNTAPELASKLFVISPVMLVRAPFKMKHAGPLCVFHRIDAF